MAVKLTCSLEGFQDNWVEVTEHWTRKDLRILAETNEVPALLALLREKLVGCHIRVEGRDEFVTRPEDLTEELIDDMDLRVWGFLAYVLTETCIYLRSLGNMSGRVLSRISDKSP